MAKKFVMGLDYLRKIARSIELIAESDNNDVLVQRLAQLAKAADEDTVAHIAKTIHGTGDESEDNEPEEEEEEEETGDRLNAPAPVFP